MALSIIQALRGRHQPTHICPERLRSERYALEAQVSKQLDLLLLPPALGTYGKEDIQGGVVQIQLAPGWQGGQGGN